VSNYDMMPSTGLAVVASYEVANQLDDLIPVQCKALLVFIIF
jgi:hypothetical protein